MLITNKQRAAPITSSNELASNPLRRLAFALLGASLADSVLTLSITFTITAGQTASHKICFPRYSVYTGGIASTNSDQIAHGIPIASLASSIDLAVFPPFGISSFIDP